jgi:ubiquinone/menaquinone biosynthesis C-methylase UbiE
MLTQLFYIVCLGLPLTFLFLHTLIRIIRHFYKFPIPQFLANAIDNPLRRRIQPPDQMALRHDLESGMTVLEVGPGNGRYSLAAARHLGPDGKLVSIDIEPRMIERLEARAQAAGAANIDARVANVYQLPFDDQSFDAVYMIAVIGEIPEPERAVAEFYRLLNPGGTLAFSELLMDPDYVRASSLVRIAEPYGFRLKHRLGGFFAYTLVFEKPASGESLCSTAD